MSVKTIGIFLKLDYCETPIPKAQ